MSLPSSLLLFIMLPSVYISVIDWKKHIIPNQIIFPMIISTVAAVLYFGSWKQALLGTAAATALLGITMLLAGPASIGMGDFKLVFCYGLALGWPAIVHAILAGSLLAGTYAFLVSVRGSFNWHTRIPLGPFFTGGYILAILYHLL